MFDPATSGVVRQSWLRLRPREHAVSVAFYRQMFARRPEYVALFQRAPHEQQKMFSQMMALIIGMLEQGEELRFLLRGLGRRHVAAGVAVERIPELIEFMLAALQECGPLSELEVVAWQRVLAEVAQQMTDLQQDQSPH